MPNHDLFFTWVSDEAPETTFSTEKRILLENRVILITAAKNPCETMGGLRLLQTVWENDCGFILYIDSKAKMRIHPGSSKLS